MTTFVFQRNMQFSLKHHHECSQILIFVYAESDICSFSTVTKKTGKQYNVL
jgi:hypothetical protein